MTDRQLKELIETYPCNDCERCDIGFLCSRYVNQGLKNRTYEELTERDRQNAQRLVSALTRHQEPQIIKALARVLDYLPEQLEQDIEALDAYLEATKKDEP